LLASGIVWTPFLLVFYSSFLKVVVVVFQGWKVIPLREGEALFQQWSRGRRGVVRRAYSSRILAFKSPELAMKRFVQ
jgi:hypothetical protein